VCEAALVLDVVMAESVGLARVIYHTIVGIHVVQVPETACQHAGLSRVEVGQDTDKARTEEEICLDPARLRHPGSSAIHEFPYTILAALALTRVAEVLNQRKISIMISSRR
jgi:hypothetical protein